MHMLVTVGDFIISNWADFHCVDQGIKVNREYCSDISWIVASQLWSVWRI